MALHLAIASEMAGEAIEVEEHSADEDGDIAEDKTYIVRGLKVVDDKWWCDGVMVTKGDGSKTVEICWRTAVEDITHVQQLARHFHW